MELNKIQSQSQSQIFNKIKPIRNLVFLLNQNRKMVVIFSFVIICTSVLSALGIGSLYPIMNLLEDNAKKITYIDYFYNVTHISLNENQFITLMFMSAGTVFLLSGVFYVFSYYVQYKLSESLKVYWQIEIFDTYLKQDYDYFVKNKTGDLIQKHMVHTEIAGSAITLSCQMARDSLLALFLYVTLCFVSFKLTMYVTVFMLIFALVSLAIARLKIYVSANESAEMQKQAFSISSETIIGIRQIKAFLAEDFFKNHFSLALMKKAKIVARNSTIGQSPVPVIQTVVLVIIVCALFYVTRYQGHTKEIIPLITVFGGSIYKAFNAISGVYGNFLQLAQILPSVNIVTELLNIKTPKDNLPAIDHFKKDIKFNNVTFSYNKNEFQLSNININFKRGKFYGIVGHSGSGKSTLVDLLIKFYSPQIGDILIDDRNLVDVDTRSWRSKIGLVSQDTFLFNGTVEENISFGRNVSDDDKNKVIMAANVADLRDYIEGLTEKYQTVIGERGLKLSGGQRQRLAIARAVYRDPEIYIFDEATSSLDVNSEKRIQKAIENLAQTKTVISIAHRLSTVVNADQIFVMENGVVVETGSHQELLDLNGFYAELYTRQASLEKSDDIRKSVRG